MTDSSAGGSADRSDEGTANRNPEHLTVQGLIRLLSTQPPHLRVVVDGYECGYDDLSAWQIQRVRIALNTGRAEYAGAHDDVWSTSPERLAEAVVAEAVVLRRRSG